MCGFCSRRGFIAGALAAAIFGIAQPVAAEQNLMACSGCSRDEFNTLYRTRTSTSGSADFDDALIVELKNIQRVIPSINPGYQYVQARNAFTTSDTIVRNTQGTVWIGLGLVNSLVDIKKQDNTIGGIAIAGVLAHECGHIYQINTKVYDRLMKDQTSAVLVELHADLLAGYYLAKKRGVGPERLAALQQVFVALGTYDRKNPKYHGTPGLRGAAMDTGYFAAQDGKSFEEAAEFGEKYVRRLV
jgi:hypothetical protein